MTRLLRTLTGAIGGALWGAGAAVLIQQYGLWPLDIALAYGAPLAGAVLSGAYGRARGRRATAASAAVVLLLLPPVVGMFQQPGCRVFIEASDGRPLGDSSPADPIRIDPDVDPVVGVRVSGEGLNGRAGRVWIEFGGIPTFIERGTARDDLYEEFDLGDNGIADLGGAPGIYHVGGEVDGICSVDGYIEILGNPMTGPIAPAALGAVGIGLLMTWSAGRPPRTGTAPRRRRLEPNGKPVRVGDVEVRSPSLEGEIEIHEPTETATSRVAGWSEETREVFTRHHIGAERVIEISETVESPHVAIGREILDHAGRPALQLDMPNPGSGKAQVVFATDESGVVSWHFPRLDTGDIDTLRPAEVLRYRIPRHVAPTDPPDRRRGIAQAAGAKVLSSLVFPLLDPVFELVGERFARVWETKRRPYRFRTFTPDDFDLEQAPEPVWDQLDGRRSLLFVHGTFSRTHTGFGGLRREILVDLHDRYEGRVFAFDHFTLSDDPRRNVEWFLAHLPDGLALDVDIVCHSRGGLVSRVLAEKQDELSVRNRRVDVGTIVFVASPNAGTILTEPTYIGDYIDSYTNLLNFLPGHHVVDVFEGIVTLVKHAAVGAVAGLDGLQAMRPGGEFLRWLNTTAANPSRYVAIAGDYEPPAAGWRAVAVNRLADQVFREPNDLVVPTAGTFGVNGSSHFPIDERLECRGDDGIDHTTYFASKQVGAQLLEWLRLRDT
jgi:hypothetical protein